MNRNLVKAFPIDDAAGVGQALCVVQGASDGSVKKPAAANAAGFVGVTIEAQANQNKSVAVAIDGVVKVTAGGTITRGDRVKIHGTTGKVMTCEALIVAAPGAASVQEVVGIALQSAVAGDVFEMLIRPYTVNIAVS